MAFGVQEIEFGLLFGMVAVLMGQVFYFGSLVTDGLEKLHDQMRDDRADDVGGDGERDAYEGGDDSPLDLAARE